MVLLKVELLFSVFESQIGGSPSLKFGSCRGG